MKICLLAMATVLACLGCSSEPSLDPEEATCCIAVTEDASRTLLGTFDGTLVVWDTKQAGPGKPLRALRPFPGAHVKAASLARDGRTALVASSDGAVATIDLATGETILDKGEGVFSTAAACRQDLGVAVLGANDGSLRIRDPSKERRSVPAHAEGPIDALAISTDGALALSAARSGPLHLTDLGAGTTVRRFFRPESDTAIEAVAFSPDGTLAATRSSDGVALWDTATGKSLFRVHSFPGSIPFVGFSGDAVFATGVDPRDETVVREIDSSGKIRREVLLSSLTGESWKPGHAAVAGEALVVAAQRPSRSPRVVRVSLSRR